MRWQEVIKDPRYINALPEQQKLIKQDWFKKNIETDPRYKPELRDKLWYRVFNEPEIRSDVTIAKSELAKLPLKSLEISHPKPGVIHKEELTPYEIKQRQGENQKLLNEWYEKYGKALTKEELANMGIEITKQVVNSYKPMKTGEKLTKLPEHKIGLYQAPPEPKPTIFQKIIKPFIKKPKEIRQRTSNIYSIKKMLDKEYYKSLAKQLKVDEDYVKENIGSLSRQFQIPVESLSYEQIEKNYDLITQQLNLRNMPTNKEMIGIMFKAGITAGLITNPLATLLSVSEFMALSEAESFIISKIKKEPYKILQMKGLSELLPKEATQVTKDVVDIIDILWKAKAIRTAYKKAPELIEKFTKDITIKYNFPRKIYIEPNKIRSMFIRGKKISPQEASLVKELGLTSKEYKLALKQGISIEVPIEKVVKIADKPYWAKVKSLFNVKPKTETKIFRPEKVVAYPKARLPEKAISIEKEPTPFAEKPTLEAGVELKPKLKGTELTNKFKAISTRLRVLDNIIKQGNISKAQGILDRYHTAKADGYFDDLPEDKIKEIENKVSVLENKLGKKLEPTAKEGIGKIPQTEAELIKKGYKLYTEYDVGKGHYKIYKKGHIFATVNPEDQIGAIKKKAIESIDKAKESFINKFRGSHLQDEFINSIVNNYTDIREIGTKKQALREIENQIDWFIYESTKYATKKPEGTPENYSWFTEKGDIPKIFDSAKDAAAISFKQGLIKRVQETFDKYFKEPKLETTAKEKIEPTTITTEEVKVAPRPERVDLKADLDKRMDSIVAKLDEKSGEFNLSEAKKEITDLETNKAKLTEGLSETDKAGIDRFIEDAKAEWSKTKEAEIEKPKLKTDMDKAVAETEKIFDKINKEYYMPAGELSAGTEHVRETKIKTAITRIAKKYKVDRDELENKVLWKYAGKRLEKERKPMTEAELKERGIELKPSVKKEVENKNIILKPDNTPYASLKDANVKRKELADLTGDIYIIIKYKNGFAIKHRPRDINWEKGFNKYYKKDEFPEDKELWEDFKQFSKEEYKKNPYIDEHYEVWLRTSELVRKKDLEEYVKPAIKKEETEKEVWKITRDEYIEKRYKPKLKSAIAGSRTQLGKLHKYEVEKALKEGKEVYKGWEKDYPDLAEKYKAKEKPSVAPKEIPKELEPLTKEARKYKSAEEWKRAFYNKLEENKMSIQGWDWNKPTGVIRYLVGFPFEKGAIKTKYEVTIDKPVSQKSFKLSIRKKGKFLSDFDLKNINLDLKDYFDKQLFEGKEAVYSSLEGALNKVKKIFPSAKEKPLELFNITNPTDFYNQAIKEAKPEKVVEKPKSEVAPKEIAEGLETLKEEAKKYKTADEFVEAQAIKKKLISQGIKVNSDDTVTLYHATSPENMAKINKEGLFRGRGTATGGMTGLDLKPSVFLGTSKKWVKDTWGVGKEIMEIKVPVKDIRQPAQNTLEVYIEGNLKRDKDGIWRPTQKPRSTFYDRLAKRDVNQQQLKDIWQQAQKEKPKEVAVKPKLEITPKEIIKEPETEPKETLKGTPKELEALKEKAKKVNEINFSRFVKTYEFQKRMKSAQDLQKEAKGWTPGGRITINSDGSITVYHGTSIASADNILKTGKIAGYITFSHSKTRTLQGDEGAEWYAKVKRKNGKVIKLSVDPRDVSINGAGEIDVEDGLIRQPNGIWTSPKRKNISNILKTEKDIKSFWQQAQKEKPKEIPKELELENDIEKAIDRIEELDIRKKKYQDEVDRIQKIQPVGQPYPSFEKALDNAIKISKQQSDIWNKIRNRVVKGTGRTLWQIAIQQKLPVNKYGTEKHLDFGGKEIRKAIKSFWQQTQKEKPIGKVGEITDYEKLSKLGKQVYRLAVLSKTGGEFINNLKAKKIAIETAKKEVGTKSLGTWQEKIKKIELAKAHKITKAKEEIEVEKRGKYKDVTEKILGEKTKIYSLSEAHDIIARHNAQLRKGQTPALSNEQVENILINAYRKANKIPTTYEFTKDINKIYYNRKTGKSDLSLQERRKKYKEYFKSEIGKIPKEGDKISIDKTFVIENTQGKKIKIAKGEEYMIYPHPTDAAKSIMQDGNQVTIWEGDLEDIAKNITILREGKIKAGGKIHKYIFETEPKQYQIIDKPNKRGQNIEEMFVGIPFYKALDIPIVIRGTKFKFLDALGSEIKRYYGLTKETRRELVKLSGYIELNKENISKYLAKEFPIEPEEAEQLTKHQEQPLKYKISNKLKPYAKKVETLLNLTKKEMAKRKLLNEFFPQSFIKRANKEIIKEQEIISNLVREDAITRHQNKIKELKEYVEFLKDLRYVPHLYIAEQEIERMVLKLLPENRLTARFRSSVSKLKGRKIDTIDKAESLGLLPEKDIRMLLASHLEYVFRKCAIYDTIENLKKNKSVIMKEKEAPSNWERTAILQLKDYRIHPLLLRAIEDFALNTNIGLIGKGYDAVNYLGKALVFYNPLILPLWDVFQGVGTGGINPFRPIHTANMLSQAWKTVVNKTGLYKKLIEGGLYKTPRVGHYPTSIESSMKLLINQMDSKYPKWKKGLEKALNQKVDWKTFSTKLIYPTLYWQNWRVTWFLDQVLRTGSVLHLLSIGMPLPDAIDYANTLHANYDLLTRRSKKWINRAFLVGTYKANMLFNAPLFLAKRTSNLFKKFATGERKKITIDEKESLKSIFRIAIMIASMIAFARWRGYRLREDYRLVKPLKEPIITKEGKIKYERVITLPGPFFEWFKVVGRIKQQKARALYMYLAKVPQIAWGLMENRRWQGDPYYDEGAATPKQRRQLLYNVLRDYIAPLDRIEMMTDDEVDAMDNIMSLLGMATYKRGGIGRSTIYKIRNTYRKLNKYLKKPNVSETDKENAYIEAQKKIDKYLKELEEYNKQFKE